MSMAVGTAERRALVTELLRLAGFFRQNAALKHGVPEAQVTRLGEEPAGDADRPPPPSPPVPGTAIEPPSSGAAPAPGYSAAGPVPVWAKALAAGAVGAALGGGGMAVGYLAADDGDSQPPAVQAHADQASGSLYQWLQDGGQHLPPEDAP